MPAPKSSRDWSLPSSKLEPDVYQDYRLTVVNRDRVMETVMQSKTLPPDMASERLGNVNLFMRAIGLDVELLG